MRTITTITLLLMQQKYNKCTRTYNIVILYSKSIENNCTSTYRCYFIHVIHVFLCYKITNTFIMYSCFSITNI